MNVIDYNIHTNYKRTMASLYKKRQFKIYDPKRELNLFKFDVNRDVIFRVLQFFFFCFKNNFDNVM